MVHYSDGNDPGFPVVCHGADAADKVIVDLQHVVNHEDTVSESVSGVEIKRKSTDFFRFVKDKTTNRKES